MNSTLADVIVLCDGESDRRLFNQLKSRHPVLNSIPDGSVRTYEQARNAREHSVLDQAIRPLHQDDRPDFIFCTGDAPLLVIELTQHAYTGDNGLQRFARFAAAAENHVPFIYFGPKARVRDDELDGLGRASPRSLTSDLFEGMRCLADVHGTPQLYVEWHTDESGLPAALPLSFTDEDVRTLYGDLLDVAATILIAQLEGHRSRDLLRLPAIREWQRKVDALAGNTNTHASEVRIEMSARELKEVILDPSQMEGFFVDNDYFNKGKPDKVLALLALRKAAISALQLPDGSVLTGRGAADRLASALSKIPKFSNPGLVYYTGYKWRSDPHSGVLVNIDYRLIRQTDEPTPADRTKPLVVFYPRVSLNQASATWQTLSRISYEKPGEIAALFKARYPDEWRDKMECLNSRGLFSLWVNRAKQARIFRRYADLIVLNDGVVVGDALSKDFATS